MFGNSLSVPNSTSTSQNGGRGLAGCQTQFPQGLNGSATLVQTSYKGYRFPFARGSLCLRQRSSNSSRQVALELIRPSIFCSCHRNRTRCGFAVAFRSKKKKKTIRRKEINRSLEKMYIVLPEDFSLVVNVPGCSLVSVLVLKYNEDSLDIKCWNI